MEGKHSIRKPRLRALGRLSSDIHDSSPISCILCHHCGAPLGPLPICFNSRFLYENLYMFLYTRSKSRTLNNEQLEQIASILYAPNLLRYCSFELTSTATPNPPHLMRPKLSSQTQARAFKASPFSCFNAAHNSIFNSKNIFSYKMALFQLHTKL